MKKLLKIVSYALVIYPALATIWQSLPVEVTSLIPQYTEYVALVTGAASFTLGGGGLVYLANIDKVKTDALATFNGLYEAYNVVNKTNTDVLEKQTTLENKQANIEKIQERIMLMLETELQARLSNPFVDDAVKAKIQEVLGVENEV